MAAPTIPNGEEYFFPILYEGNGEGRRVGKFVPFTDSGTIANSVIYNRVDTPKLARTPSSDGNRKTFTISVWYKPTDLGTDRSIMAADTSASGTNYAMFKLNDSNKLWFYSGTAGGGDVISTRTFEDSSKFYHFMVAVDTTQSTASNRVKFYVDGDLITSLDSASYPSQDGDTNFNSTSYPMAVGSFNSLTSICAGGNLAEFNFVDGQALTPASFGLTDTSTGRWIPKTVSPYPTTTTDIAVTVVSSGGNKYALDGVTQGTVTLIEGATYKFDQSDSSNSGHPLRFSTTSDGTHGGGSEFTSGVTTVGTPGSSGAYTEITVPTGTATLYYYCTNHSGMRGTANTQDQYGTNGFRLKFQDSSARGDDTSGNTNDFTATNLTASDQTTDSPTQNFNTMGSFNSGVTKAEGNLKITTPSSGGGGGYSQCVGQPAFGVRSGKWYWEVKVNVKGQSGYGWKSDDNTGGSQASDGLSTGYTSYQMGPIYVVGGLGGYADGTWDVNLSTGASEFSAFTTASVDDVIMFALDLDNRKGYVGLNGTWFNSANPANGTGSIGLGRAPVPSANARFYPMCFRLGATATGTYNFGGTSFAHTPPTGFVALGQDNLPEATKGISGLVWTKNRDASDSHQLYDSSRGRKKVIFPDVANVESTVTDGLQKFLAGGQQIEDNDAINTAGESFVSWNWVANGSTTSSNTDGAITSTTQVNSTAGFSIIQYIGNGVVSSIGHGLSIKPKFFILKSTSIATSWVVYHEDIGANYALYLDSTSAKYGSVTTPWNNTTPTSSIISLMSTGYSGNNSGETYIIYAWHEVDGFSKFGSYKGNGNTDGPFIYTGFRPAWLLIKRTDSSTGGNWSIIDNRRSTFNPVGKPLLADDSGAESGLSDITMDLLSNGFKIRNTLNSNNNSSGTYVYMAFAEHPFVGDGTSPVTAR